jgi:hypothetical protein
MIEPTADSKRSTHSQSGPKLRICQARLLLGILAVFPYLSILLWIILYRIFAEAGVPGGEMRRLSGAVLDVLGRLGMGAGLPLGLAGIITGGIGLRGGPHRRHITIPAMCGILLGAAGIVGQLWFFVNKICCI